MYTKTPVYVKKYPSSELLAPTIILRQHMFLYSENRQRPNTNRAMLPYVFYKFSMVLLVDSRKKTEASDNNKIANWTAIIVFIFRFYHLLVYEAKRSVEHSMQ